MDIDEFLDRELADLGLGDRRDKINASKEEGDILSVSDKIRPELGKGGLEQAEQEYMQLWGMLVQQKLKWNRELYDQLNSLSRQVSSSLGQSFDEVKRKANHIYSLISRARGALKEGKKDLPMKLYAEMQETNDSIPAVFFEEKKAIQEQIILFYRELVNATDNELSRRISNITNQIFSLVASIDNLLRAGNIEEASSAYMKCTDLFSQIPEGFLKARSSIGMRLLDIYRILSIQGEISSLQSQLGPRPQPVLQRTQPRAYPKMYQRPVARAPEPEIRKASANFQQRQQKKIEKAELPSSEILLEKKRNHAKKNIKKGFYNEAWKDVEEALQIEPNDVESKALKAKIKTLQ